MLYPIVDIDVRQVQNTRSVVSTEDSGHRVRDKPSESWSKVVVVAHGYTHLLKRDIASVSGKDAYKTSMTYQMEGMLEWTLP
jgi:hypothetical protein